jgi:hypothetical protein
MKTLLKLLPLSLLILPGASKGQNVAVDEGVFRVSIGGEIVGREEFTVRRVGLGADARLILRATIELNLPTGRQALAPALGATGPRLSVMDYQMIKTGTESSETYVRRSDRRFLARTISSRGEEVREYRAGPGSVILDPFVAHQHHLLIPYLEEPGSVSLTVLSPEPGTQARMTFTFIGEEDTRVGAIPVPARRYRLEGGGGPRHLWFDSQGRILRVEIPGLAYLAERESLG